jgi:putative PIN family toxin of toxin-antitoxin system
VVLDATVTVSAILPPAEPSELRHLWQKGAITVLLSREILKEYLEAPARPKLQYTQEEMKSLIEKELLPFAHIIKPGIRVHVAKRHLANNTFLECAVAGRADILIANDRELLIIRHYRGVRIQTPSRFLAGIPQLLPD